MITFISAVKEGRSVGQIRSEVRKWDGQAEATRITVVAVRAGAIDIHVHVDRWLTSLILHAQKLKLVLGACARAHILADRNEESFVHG